VNHLDPFAAAKVEQGGYVLRKVGMILFRLRRPEIADYVNQQQHEGAPIPLHLKENSLSRVIA
jgi:hypothetical protein